ncbi:hypothetical protein H9X57_14825 [Flavobacterium piscinae]|nr:hypothetical protein [Flavobacterium piscinae]MBC8884169.1 hypothetical protein [Flavobacterium piscinae]
MLELKMILKDKLFKEDENKLIIQSTTLNNHPFETKGEIKLYEIQKKSF